MRFDPNYRVTYKRGDKVKIVNHQFQSEYNNRIGVVDSVCHNGSRFSAYSVKIDGITVNCNHKEVVSA